MNKVWWWVVDLAVLLWIAYIFIGCSPAPQAHGQEPVSKFNSKQWTFVPMTGGPSLHTACHNGHRLYLMDSYQHRENEWHGTSPKTLAVVKEGCESGR